MSFCCVPGCFYKNLAKKMKVSSHTFPKDEAVKKAWIKAVNNPDVSEDISPSELKKYQVCGKHFLPSDFEVDQKYMLAPHLYPGKPRAILKRGAVPTILLPQQAEVVNIEPEVSVSEVDVQLHEHSPTMVGRKRKTAATTDEMVQQPSPKVRRVEELRGQSPYKKKVVPSSTVTSEMIAQQVTPTKEVIEPSTSSPLSTVSSPLAEFSSPGWLPSAHSSSDSTDVENAESSKKAIVNLSCLEELFRKCQICGDGIDTTSTSYKGAQIIINWRCVMGHQDVWKSCPDIRRMPEINLLSSAATLFSGNSFSGVSRLFEYLDLPFISSTTYHRIQNTYLLPVVDQFYRDSNLSLVGEMILKGMEGIPVSLLGDGRSDSPGFSAKYTTYTMMEETSEKIVDFQLVQVSEASSSVAMEKIGFQRCLEGLEEHGIQISTITTDRSPSIIKFMRENYPDIIHQFDVWHVCKGIKKRLLSSGKKKGNEILLKWTKSITNHFWFSCASCDGDYEVLKSTWLGLLNHIKDVHEWDHEGNSMKCAHDRLTDVEREQKRWIDESSTAYSALVKIISDNRLIRDMKKLTLFKHTGTLESYHSMMLKYIPKRIHYHFKAMQGRTQLAVLDHNENVGRKQACTRNKQPRYNIVGRKQDPGTFKARKVFEPKIYPHIPILMQETIKRRMDKTIKLKDETHHVHTRELPRNIYKVPIPPRQEVIRASERLAAKIKK